MGRALFRAGLILTVVFPVSLWGMGQMVFDATNATHFSSMVIQAGKHLDQLQMLSSRVDDMNYRIGGVLPSSALDKRSSYLSIANEWQKYLEGFSSIDGNSQSLLSLSGVLKQAGSNQDFYPYMFDKLYSHGNMGLEKMEEMKKFRMDAVERSSTQGVVLAGRKKHNLIASQKKIADLGREGLSSSNIHDDLVVVNKNLSLIASELIQQRELLSQQLELLSAVVAQSSPMISKR